MESTSANLKRLATAVAGAERSLDVMFNVDVTTSARKAFAGHVLDSLLLADARLDRHGLVFHPPSPRARPFLSELGAAGWDLRQMPVPGSLDLLLIDGSQLLTWQQADGRFRLQVLRHPGVVDQISSFFNRTWQYALSDPSTVLLYEDALGHLVPETEAPRIDQPRTYWDELIARLASRPAELLHLKPREFEELIAELLAREGLSVQLTPATRDGGRDVLATHYDRLGRHLYLVECKRYTKERPVSVDVVRSLYGVVEGERATAGMLVTTSHFTLDALLYAAPLQYRMSLQEYDHLVQWLQDVSRGWTR